MPTPTAHGLMVIPTAHGGALVGTADDIDDKTDTATHQDVLEHILEEGRELMPELDQKYVVEGLRGTGPIPRTGSIG